MSLTANFDYCVELGIEQIKTIFHLAFKEEDRFPHNVPATFTASGQTFNVIVNVLDDDARPADLSFRDDKHILFDFPIDINVAIPDAPDPTLSSVTLHATVAVPGKLDNWQEQGKDILGPSFLDVTVADVQILDFTGLPAITADNFRNAIHQRYQAMGHSGHVFTQGANTLNIYDGSRDTMLMPPNTGAPFEIQADLETHSGTDYLKVVLPIYVNIPLSGGDAYTSFGRITFWRPVTRTDTSITLAMGMEPTDPALQTTVALDNPSVSSTTEIDQILAAIHSRYDVMTHTNSLLGNTLIFYDDTRDAHLTPPNSAIPADIEADLETHSGTEYLKVTVPIYVNVPMAFYSSYGHIVFWRQVSRTSATISIDMSMEPSDTSLKTQVNLDNGPSYIRSMVVSQLTPLVVTAISGFGIVTSPAAGSVADQLRPMAISAINTFGTITEPAFTDAAARGMLAQKVAQYIQTRRFPVYSPDSGDPNHPLTTPVGFLLVADGILAILMNRRHGTEADDQAPDNFLGSDPLALAVGSEFILDTSYAAIDAKFSGLHHGHGASEIHRSQGDATLMAVDVALADPGDHGQSAGHLWLTGEAEVHIKCWPDPDVTFEGPIFIDAHQEGDADNCTLPMHARAGHFNVGESCCNVFLDILIPIVGWIMLAVVESTIDSVGGEIASESADSETETIQAIPKVVVGVAKVEACLTTLNIHRQGFVFPGTITIRRADTSYEDRQGDSSLPRPDSP